jgi:protein tyrosine phosphatase (PTP) superfamily phosphohydrolase (DUF442 family)
VGLLRHYWTNVDEVRPGLMRGNHPPPWRLRRMAEGGLKSVLTLRGPSAEWHFRREVETCRELGISLTAILMHARTATPGPALVAALDWIDTAPRPAFFHCKSGADRTGLVGALWLLSQGASDDEALGQLSFRYLHLSGTATGICDLVVQSYLEARRDSGVALRDWLLHDYDPQAVDLVFQARGAAG